MKFLCGHGASHYYGDITPKPSTFRLLFGSESASVFGPGTVTLPFPEFRELRTI